MSRQASILCTGPIDRELADRVATIEGLSLEVMPFIDINYFHHSTLVDKVHDIASRELNIVFTSQNGVGAVTEILAGKETKWTIFCLGNKTEYAVGQCFEKNKIMSECDNAQQLADVLIAHGISELTFFCGDSRMDILPDALAAAGVRVEEVVVYGMKEIHHAIAREYDGILFFSPSAVRSYFTTNEIGKTTILFAIGETTATEVRKWTNRPVIVSQRPSKEQLINDSVCYFELSNW